MVQYKKVKDLFKIQEVINLLKVDFNLNMMKQSVLIKMMQYLMKKNLKVETWFLILILILLDKVKLLNQKMHKVLMKNYLLLKK